MTGVFFDMHCHCLPGIDDGPQTMNDAIALCRALVADGVGTVAATPHQLGRYGELNDAAKVRDKVCALNAELHDRAIPLTVLPGADVRVDERICNLLEEDRVLTLGDGGRYILLELPHDIFIDIEPLIFELAGRGIRAILSHPERHAVLAKHPELLNKWLQHSVLLQLTAGSLIGDFGPLARDAAWRFLASHSGVIVASDSHDLHDRPPRMRPAYGLISGRLGKDTARRVCIDSPSGVLAGEDVYEFGTLEIGKCNNGRIPDFC